MSDFIAAMIALRAGKSIRAEKISIMETQNKSRRKVGLFVNRKYFHCQYC